MDPLAILVTMNLHFLNGGEIHVELVPIEEFFVSWFIIIIADFQHNYRHLIFAGAWSRMDGHPKLHGK
jgi:hypothetical protein